MRLGVNLFVLARFWMAKGVTGSDLGGALGFAERDLPVFALESGLFEPELIHELRELVGSGPNIRFHLRHYASAELCGAGNLSE